MVKVKVKSLSRVRLSATPWIVACPASPSMGFFFFSGKSTGVGCGFLLQGTFLIQGSKPALPHCRQRIYFSEGWKYSKADRGGGRTSRNVQPSRPPVLTRHTQDTLPLPSPSWTGGLGGEHAEGQKVKGSGEGGEARRNGKPGQSHRDLGSNASPAGYKLWDLSQLLSLPEPRFPRLLWEVIMRLEPVGVRSPPGRKESRGYFWVAAGDRACPQKSQASGCPCNPPPALVAPPRKERRLELLQDHPADTRPPIPPWSVHRLPPGSRQHRSRWAGCLTWVRIVQPRFSDPS